MRQIRRDALPEHTDYSDDGCHVHPTCITCPLERCIYDDRRAQILHRATEMRRAFHKGASVRQVMKRFGISRRTVFRWMAWLREAEPTVRIRTAASATSPQRSPIATGILGRLTGGEP